MQCSPIVYVDESGLEEYYNSEYGWAKIGQKVVGIVKGKKYQRYNIVSGLLCNKAIEPLLYSGTMDSSLFEYWFEKHLLANLPKNTTIIMDNAAFHRKGELFSIAQEYQMNLIFLLPYAPEYNPIEKFWANLKKKLRKITSKFDTFLDAIFECFKL